MIDQAGARDGRCEGRGRVGCVGVSDDFVLFYFSCAGWRGWENTGPGGDGGSRGGGEPAKHMCVLCTVCTWVHRYERRRSVLVNWPVSWPMNACVLGLGVCRGRSRL